MRRAALATTLVLAIVPPALAGPPATPPNSSSPQKAQPVSATSATAVPSQSQEDFVVPGVLIWYQRKVQDPQKAEWRDYCRNVIKSKAYEAGRLPWGEFDISDDAPDEGAPGKVSDRELYYKRMPLAEIYADNLAQGQVLAQRVLFTRDRRHSKPDTPSLFNGAFTPDEQMALLLKPFVRSATSQIQSSTVAPHSPKTTAAPAPLPAAASGPEVASRGQ